GLGFFGVVVNVEVRGLQDFEIKLFVLDFVLSEVLSVRRVGEQEKGEENRRTRECSSRCGGEPSMVHGEPPADPHIARPIPSGGNAKSCIDTGVPSGTHGTLSHL